MLSIVHACVIFWESVSPNRWTCTWAWSSCADSSSTTRSSSWRSDVTATMTTSGAHVSWFFSSAHINSSFQDTFIQNESKLKHRFLTPVLFLQALCGPVHRFHPDLQTPHDYPRKQREQQEEPTRVRHRTRGQLDVLQLEKHVHNWLVCSRFCQPTVECCRSLLGRDSKSKVKQKLVHVSSCFGRCAEDSNWFWNF